MGNEINVPHDAQRVFKTPFGVPVYLKLEDGNAIQVYMYGEWTSPASKGQSFCNARWWDEAEEIKAN